MRDHSTDGYDMESTRRGEGLRRAAAWGLGGASCLAVAGGATAQVFIPTENNVNAILSADLNRDGWADAVIIEYGGRMRVFLSSGGGAFGEPVIYDLGSDSVRACVADMDGDFAPDLVVAMRVAPGQPARIVVVRNLGDGSFDPAWSVRSVERDGVPQIAVADMDGDGDRDTIYILPAPLLPSSEVYWIENDGSGRLGQQHEARPAAGSFHYGVVAGDLDNDGDVDLALISSIVDQYQYNTQNVLNVMLNQGDGQTWNSFSFNVPRSTHFWDSLGGLGTGDFDGDGDFDIVLANYRYNDGSRVHFAVNDGQAGFDFVIDLPTSHDHEVQCTDIDADGDVDVLLPDYGVDVTRIVQNRGDGFAVLGLTVEGGTTVAASDMNDDGMLDLITGRRFPQRGVQVTFNPLRLDRPRLTVSPLRAGEPATFRISNLQPGAEVQFFYSLSGVGASLGLPALGGVTLDLERPLIQFGVAVANPEGVARLVRPVPSQAPHATVVIQAVAETQPGGGAWKKSNFVTEAIR